MRGRRADHTGVLSIDGIVGIIQEVRRCEVRTVHHVEKLRTELYLKPFLETGILERGEVHGG